MKGRRTTAEEDPGPTMQEDSELPPRPPPARARSRGAAVNTRTP